MTLLQPMRCSYMISNSCKSISGKQNEGNESKQNNEWNHNDSDPTKRKTQLKKMSESIGTGSPFSLLLENIISKAWLLFNEKKTRKIEIKERHQTASKKDPHSFRVAFDSTKKTFMSYCIMSYCIMSMTTITFYTLKQQEKS